MVHGIICSSIWYVMVYNMGRQTIGLLPAFVNKKFYWNIAMLIHLYIFCRYAAFVLQ